MSSLTDRVGTYFRGHLFRRIVIASGYMLFWVAAAAGQSSDRSEADRLFNSLDTNQDGRLRMDDSQGNNRELMAQIFAMSGKAPSESLSRDDFQKVYEQHQRGQGRDVVQPGKAPPESMAGRNRPDPSGEDPPVGLDTDEVNWTALVKWCDTNGDGRLTRAEWNRLSQLWIRLDADRDGGLDSAEIQKIEQTVAAMPGSDRSSDDKAPRPERGNQARGPRAENNSSEMKGAVNTIEGRWRGMISGGQGHQNMEVELVIQGNRISGRELTGGRPMQDLGMGSFTMTGQGSGNLDAEGIAGREEGRQFLGIYELNANTLRWCVSNRGRQRPQTMSTDRGNYLLVMQRVP